MSETSDDKYMVNSQGFANQNRPRREEQKIRLYNLTKHQAALERHAGHDRIKSLRDEIGILRLLLETKLNLCTTDMDLLAGSQAIGDLVIKVEKLVTSCHKMEELTGQVLDKAKLAQFADQVVAILSEHVPQDKLAIIGALICNSLSTLTTTSSDPDAENDRA